MYLDDPLNNNNIQVGDLGWLFKEVNDTYVTPSSGMRSSIPHGSMGGGILEMRGDGRITNPIFL